MFAKRQTHSIEKTNEKQPSARVAGEQLDFQSQPQLHPATAIQRAAPDSPPLLPRDAVQLQSTVGNQAVNRLLDQTLTSQANERPKPKAKGASEPVVQRMIGDGGRNLIGKRARQGMNSIWTIIDVRGEAENTEYKLELGDMQQWVRGDEGKWNICGEFDTDDVPLPKNIPRVGPKSCHEFVIWRVMQDDLGMDERRATACLSFLRTISSAGNLSGSLHYLWYGREIVKGGELVNEYSVRRRAVGDILILPDLKYPMHTMMIVGQTNGGTFIRGFNNFRTLGTGAVDTDDPYPRDLHAYNVPEACRAPGSKTYWKADGNFSQPLYAISREVYRRNLSTQLAINGLIGLFDDL